MKYVRVYESDYVESEYLTTYQEHCEYVAKIQDNGYDFEGCIIKQADTIEELCDEFVAISKDNKFRSLVKIEETGNRWVEDKITQWLEILTDKLVKWDIYGAIWTDKGLIYVAKMNTKGDLELL